MTNFETIQLEKDKRGVATITLNRVEKHNALNSLMIKELTEVAAQIGSDETVRAVVLAANGKSFCAGGDLKWMQSQMEKDRDGKMEESRGLANMLGALNSLPKFLIAKVQGSAYGGGVGMMAVADVVIANSKSKFALTETKLGLIPATIGPFVVNRMGENFARQVFYSGKPFTVEFAKRAGLVTTAVEAEDLNQAVEEEISAILKCAPGAIADAKALCQNLAGKAPSSQADYTANQLADRWESKEAMAGIEAFFNKQTAPWINETVE